MKIPGTLVLLGSILCGLSSAAQREGAVSTSQPAAALIGAYSLPRHGLSKLGNPAISEVALQQARRFGLKFIDLPSIGSGLAKISETEFYGITDRGPNGFAGSGDSDDPDARRTFPLPQFAPTIVRFKLDDKQIVVVDSIPLRDSKGKFLTGLSNVEGDERLFESGERSSPLPLDPGGVDPEAVRVLPDGTFLVSEEYSPSILVVSAKGEVLMRYTPKSKPLTGAPYPVRPILPDVFAQRRVNKGFENLAVTPDGRFAFAILQCPMGDEDKKRYGESRVIRAVKLDISRPLEATVVGEYLTLASPAPVYSAKQKQEKISWSDAESIGPDTMLVLERGKESARVLLVDFSRATNILGRKEEPTLDFEDSRVGRGVPGIQHAVSRELFVTTAVGITATKIEGLAVIGPNEIALSNDNDFGIGDNKTGEPSMVWKVRLSTPLQIQSR